ncbi:MAG: TonB-dependent receptor [Cephaloticoccus sp.]|nr:TonB-dependent receptor [Cephaloticoccus sp.]
MKNKHTPPAFRKVVLLFRICAVFLLGAGSLFAQETANSETDYIDHGDEEVVDLPVFEVKSTQGGGYVSHHAMSGFRSRKELLDIPQAITVVPRDLIDDIGQFRNEVDIVKYAAAGISSEHKGNQPHMRGFRSNVILEDGVWDNTFNNGDSANVDAYEVLRGPAAVLYGGRPTLAGIIVRNTKKPTMNAAYMVRGIVGSENFYRGEFDATGPLSESLFGSSAKLSYRVVAGIQRDEGFPTGNKDDREMIFPTLQLEFPDTVFRLQGEISEQRTAGVELGFFDNNFMGSLYIGSDKGQNQLWKEKWSEATFTRKKIRLDVEHRFNDQWNLHVVAYRNIHDRRDFDIRPAGNPNFTTMTWAQNYFHNGSNANLSVFSADLVGKYELFGLSHESFFGLNADRLSIDGFRSTYPLGTISLVNPAFNRAKPVLPANVNDSTSDNIGDNGHVSYSHTLNLIDKKLSLVAGFGRNYVNNRSYNLVNPGPPTFEQTVRETTFRLGAVYRPVRSVSFFVNNSSTFLPQTNQDYLGNFLASTEGEVVDVGVKFNTADERIVGSITYFDLTASNIRVQDFDHPGFWLASGKQNNKGLEIELAVVPFENAQIIATYYKGDIKDVDTGLRLNNSVNDTWSLVGKYDFKNGPLAGLTLGGSAYHQGYRLQGGALGWPGWTVVNAFASYRVSASLQFSLNVENLDDKLYSPGGFNVSGYASMGAPRNAKLTATYRF